MKKKSEIERLGMREEFNGWLTNVKKIDDFKVGSRLKLIISSDLSCEGIRRGYKATLVRTQPNVVQFDAIKDIMYQFERSELPKFFEVIK